MQPIIRHTITITLTETWTITWADGQEMVWEATHEVARPADREPDELLPPLTNDEENDDDTPNPDAAATEDA